MSLKSFFRKKHKYETQADLKDMTAEQIVSLNPSDVGYYIEQETGGVTLDKVKKRAIDTLLSIKKYNKANPNERARQGAISRFLDREGIKPNPEVDAVIAEATRELMKEDDAKLKEQIDMKKVTNRLRVLNNQPPIPYTEEEDMFIRLQKLGGKGKRKTVSKRKRREKTRKGRKGRKTNRRR
jgi:hypothetical protein